MRSGESGFGTNGKRSFGCGTKQTGDKHFSFEDFEKPDLINFKLDTAINFQKRTPTRAIKQFNVSSQAHVSRCYCIIY